LADQGGHGRLINGRYKNILANQEPKFTRNSSARGMQLQANSLCPLMTQNVKVGEECDEKRLSCTAD
jgi:hypothetical protein